MICKLQEEPKLLFSLHERKPLDSNGYWEPLLINEPVLKITEYIKQNIHKLNYEEIADLILEELARNQFRFSKYCNRLWMLSISQSANRYYETMLELIIDDTNKKYPTKKDKPRTYNLYYEIDRRTFYYPVKTEINLLMSQESPLDIRPAQIFCRSCAPISYNNEKPVEYSLNNFRTLLLNQREVIHLIKLILVYHNISECNQITFYAGREESKQLKGWKLLSVIIGKNAFPNEYVFNVGDDLLEMICWGDLLENTQPNLMRILLLLLKVINHAQRSPR